jgi:hypothetical protein
MNETLLPMYEVLIQIQEALTNSSETPNDSEGSEKTEPIVDDGNAEKMEE